MNKWEPVENNNAECFNCGAGYKSLEYRNPFYGADNPLHVAFTDVKIRCNECGDHQEHWDSVKSLNMR